MSLFITGTDTDAGKTRVAGSILTHYGPDANFKYWKPVQSGYPKDDDTESVRRISGFASSRFLSPFYRLEAPLSPHRAAELEGESIALEVILGAYREQKGTLLLEGAGGLLVPLNRYITWVDFLKQTDLSVLVVARTGLGTINHSLLTIEKLFHSEIPVAGIFFFGPDGDASQDNIKTILDFSGVPYLGRIESNEKGFPQGEVDPDGILDQYLL